MSSYRAAELYVQRRFVTALNLVKTESETPESVAEKYLEAGLSRDYPGIFDVVAESEQAFDQTRESNKKRVESWMATIKQLKAV